MAWEKMKPIEGGHGGCLCCGYQHDILQMESVISVGFGVAALTKNGAVVYDGERENDFDKIWTAQKAEDEAIKDPDHDWRIHLVAPLSERHYQRQGEAHWVLYDKGIGFA
jgi:hypothetical protein